VLHVTQHMQEVYARTGRFSLDAAEPQVAWSVESGYRVQKVVIGWKLARQSYSPTGLHILFLVPGDWYA
jgi:hypothetical protein